ncbi:MAG TPA: conjugative transposon protein TraJ [Puia sp.]|nr:conjugative transposon protein TraJ [Puia sp.]
MKKHFKNALIGAAGMLCPVLSQAQDSGLSGEIGGLQATLQQVYNTMIVHCSELIGVSRAIAGLATLWFVAARVWGHIARAEPVDVYPLLKPFGIGLAITLFPYVIALINGVMQPAVSGTAALVNDSNQAVATLLQQKQEALKNSNDWQMYVNTDGSGNLDKWEALSGEADSGVFSGVSNRVKFEMAKASYNLKNSIKVWLSEILQVLFEAAALAINTVRTFYLIILAILGPLALGLSVFDGFGHLLTNWLARYINVFLWLPIANLFGSLISQIQQEMIRLDIAQLNSSGQTSFGPTDSAYIVFLLLAIVGYFTVPSIANYIVSGGGMGAHLTKVNRRRL